LFIGLLLWVVLLLRALLPAFKDKNLKSLLFVVVLATVSIGLLYAAGFMWGKNTNLSIMEYWRWWVVHLWVEGVFEVFATAIISVCLSSFCASSLMLPVFLDCTLSNILQLHSKLILGITTGKNVTHFLQYMLVCFIPKGISHYLS
jgi:nitric oxide reductase large subunit